MGWVSELQGALGGIWGGLLLWLIARFEETGKVPLMGRELGGRWALEEKTQDPSTGLSHTQKSQGLQRIRTFSSQWH